MYQKLNKALLPNLKYVDPEVAQASAVYNPGNEYGVDFIVDHFGARFQRGQDP
ncbi:MAG: hypothetical protein WDM77_15180 [Steroidobacteraceae bacterium]